MVLMRSANRLLGAADPPVYDRLVADAETVSLRHGQVLFKPGEQLRHVFFPETVVLVLVTLMDNGDSIESGTAGREGAMWISAIFGPQTMPCQTMVAVDGTALKIGIEV